MLRHVFRTSQCLQLVHCALVVLFTAIDETKGQAVFGRVGFLIPAVFLKEFAEAVAGKCVVLLIVRAARAVEQHLRRLLLRHLRYERTDRGDENETQEGGSIYS